MNLPTPERNYYTGAEVLISNIMENKQLTLIFPHGTLAHQLAGRLNARWKSVFCLRFLDSDCMLNDPASLFDAPRSFDSYVLAYDFSPPTFGHPRRLPSYTPAVMVSRPSPQPTTWSHTTPAHDRGTPHDGSSQDVARNRNTSRQARRSRSPTRSNQASHRRRDYRRPPVAPRSPSIESPRQGRHRSRPRSHRTDTQPRHRQHDRVPFSATVLAVSAKARNPGVSTRNATHQTMLPPRHTACSSDSRQQSALPPSNRIYSHPSVDDCIVQLEVAYDRESAKRTAPGALPNAMSKAVRQRAPLTAAPSVLPDSITPSTPPRAYDVNPDSSTLPDWNGFDTDGDSDVAARNEHRERRRAIRANQITAAQGYWGLLARPRATASLIVLDAIPEPALVMLRRGRDFARMVPSLGINPATKRSRLIAAQTGLGYDGLRTQFAEDVSSFNSTVLHLRALTSPKRSPPAQN